MPHRTDSNPPVDESADARELESYVPTGDAIDQQAAAWLRQHQAGLDETQAALLQSWLDAAPAHRASFGRHQALAAELDALPAEGVAALKAGLGLTRRSESQPEPARAAPPIDPVRRGWSGARMGRMPLRAALSAVALVVAAGGWLAWQEWLHRPLFSMVYSTERGQQTAFALPDGTRLELDTASRVEVTLYRHRREVQLPAGQAMFEVKADPTQPFEVLAGPLRITVTGTRFSVRNTIASQGRVPGVIPGSVPGGLEVAVEEGRVRLEATPARRGRAGPEPAVAATIYLAAGQQVEMNHLGILAPLKTVAAAGVAPWREGRVSFDDTPLALALAEFERYGDTSLRIDDPAVARLRLNGSFDVHKADNFAHALTRVLPVKLVKRGEHTTIVLMK